MNFPRILLALSALTFSSAINLSSPALAQVTLPGSAEAGRFDQAIGLLVPTARSESEVGSSNSDIEIQAIETGTLFVLNGVEFIGSSIFSDAEIRSLFQDYIGTQIDAGTVFSMADKATALYRSDGYILSQVIVPPQEIDDGIVQLQAIEGYVDSVVVEGELGSQRGLVADYGRKIMQSRPLHSGDLERYLLLAGDIPGLDVEGIFSPSANTVGASTLTIKTEYDLIEGTFAVLNYGSHAVGPWTSNVELAFNSVFGQHERIVVKGAAAAEFSELNVGEIHISTSVGTEGTTIFGSMALSTSQPGDGLQVHGVTSNGQRFSVGGNHAFIRSRHQNLFAGIQFNWDDLHSNSDSFGVLSDDHLRVVRGIVEYDVADTALGAPAVTVARGILSVGMDVFGATAASDPLKSRTNADGSFVSFGFTLERLQKLGDSPFSLLVGTTGQVADGPLLASEEFGFGGGEYGRGFDPSAFVGDQAIAAKIELQYQGEVGAFSNVLEHFQIYTFVDGGIVENLNFDGFGNSQTQSAWSAGGGARFGFANNLSADIAIAYRGTDHTSVTTVGDNWRALFKLEGQF